MSFHAQKIFSVEQLNTGDKQAFSEAFLIYYSALCYFSKKIVGDADSAEDIVEELFLKLWNRHEEFENEQHLKAFLYRSVKNASFNFIKLSQRSEQRNHVFTEQLGTEQESCLHDIIHNEIAREIYQAIKELPLQCGKVISMSYLEGLSNQEIADKMGLSIQTIKNQKMRGLSLLRNRLPLDTYFLLLTLPYIPFLDVIGTN